MRPIRVGKIISIEVLKQQEGSVVHKFFLDSNPTEELTVCVPNTNRLETPVVEQNVLVYLHPEDSKWAKHAVQMVRDVPERNVQWVHKAINLMKRDMTDAEFLDWCKRVVLHSGT